MFITSQAAAYNTATRSQRHHKDNGDHVKTKHRNHDKGASVSDSVKIAVSSKISKKYYGQKQDHLFIPPLLKGKHCRSHSHLDAIISPRKAMGSSPLLLRRSNSLELLQLPFDYEKSGKEMINLHASLLRRSSKQKDRTVLEKTPTITVENQQNLASSLHLSPRQSRKKRAKHDSLRAIITQNNILKLAEDALHRTSSMPSLSPNSKKNFLLPISHENIFIQESIEVPILDFIGYKLSGGETSQDNEDDETDNDSGKIVGVETTSVIRNNFVQNGESGTSHPSYNHALPDKIIPLHSGAIVRKPWSQHVLPINGEIVKPNGEMQASTEEITSLNNNNAASFAYGKGLIKGTIHKPAIFYVVLGKADSWSDIKIEISGPRVIPPKFTLQHEDEQICRATYLPETVGTHKVSIKSKGKHVRKSPFKINVHFDKVSVWQRA